MFAALLVWSCGHTHTDTTKETTSTTTPAPDGKAPGFSDKKEYHVSVLGESPVSLVTELYIENATNVKIYMADSLGDTVRVIANGMQNPGGLRLSLNKNNLKPGRYTFNMLAEGKKWSAPFSVP